MITALLAGLTFGLSAGLSPGPLSLLVITQTLRYGAREGVRVAFAPLVTDAPIVLLSVAAAAWLAATRAALGVLSLIGGGFVLYLAYSTFKATLPEVDESKTAPQSLLRGALVNLLSPHPYLFWFGVGAPTMTRAIQSDGLVSGGAFLLGFYVCLVGAKAALALLVGQSRRLILDRAYRWLMRALSLILVVFAALLLRDGVQLLATL
ncbi:MAG: LysE family transporter [Anaerolineae bacterium]|nr:LysE family transporter [Thermoflexales bacterium]MDW8395754.1 LysE family transporter [Anaerolineae bacterium]